MRVKPGVADFSDVYKRQVINRLTMFAPTKYLLFQILFIFYVFYMLLFHFFAHLSKDVYKRQGIYLE